ncbi:MAG: thiamine-phosphate kinase [Phycisphaeraceae bacterium]|nr:thiamine-phosphate kinase [Phycisphaeraceae bacterium]
MRECELLAKIAERSGSLARKFPQVTTGPGDDCAVVRIANTDCLLTVDQVIEGRHFRKGTPLDLVARKAIARSLSDIAAMAGTPVCALATGALPRGFPQPDADALFESMKGWAEHWQCPLVGGDIASLPCATDPLTITVTIVGSPHPSRGAVLRSGAQPGDGIYVTGTLGGTLDAATGLGKHLTFEPRLQEARALAEALGPRLHAMMDISDGLGRDATRMASASSARFEIRSDLIPGESSDWRRAASDGEDYELLFAAAGAVDSLLPGGLRISRIGSVGNGRGCGILDGTATIDAHELGWEHR